MAPYWEYVRWAACAATALGAWQVIPLTHERLNAQTLVAVCYCVADQYEAPGLAALGSSFGDSQSAERGEALPDAGFPTHDWRPAL